jgi:putative acetyltransferase
MAKPGDDAQTGAAGLSLRPYDPRDEDAAIALWLRSWQAAYPAIDFAARLGWWRERWRQELVPAAEIVVAEAAASSVS